MSHELSYDGDSDQNLEGDYEIQDKSFSFDANSHVNFAECLDSAEANIRATELETDRIRLLHTEIEDLLSPKNEADKPTIETTETTFTPQDSTVKREILSKEEATKDIDNRSVYVGNVDYTTTAQDLSAHFSSCGTINRITIGSNKFSGTPKGFAYIEFSDHDAVLMAIALNETMFKGREIKVCPKRTNIPGLSLPDKISSGRGRGRGRGRGFSSRGRGSSHFVRKSRGRSSFRGSQRSSRLAPY